MSHSRTSYDHGTSDRKLIGETIGSAFDRTVAQHGNREALVVIHQQVRWTWSQLAERVEALAAGLLALGLEPGDRVGIWAPNCSEWTLTQFATAKAGLILVNINPAYRRAELDYALNKVECKALILAPALKTSDYLAILNDLAPELASAPLGALHSATLPHLRHVVRLGSDRTPGMRNFDELLALGGTAERERIRALAQTLQFDDPINIQFTSGTTGFPKGATLTHQNILNNGYFVAEAIRLTE
ncbi:MAG: AMP-binding protein, partial [Burkholderiales bacterium]